MVLSYVVVFLLVKRPSKATSLRLIPSSIVVDWQIVSDLRG